MKKKSQAEELAKQFHALAKITSFVREEKPIREYEVILKWTVSRGRDTAGYNVCTILVDGKKCGQCNGGGYDMEGTVIGEWLQTFDMRLFKMIDKPYYGLSFHDPFFNVNNEVLEHSDGTFTDKPDEGKTLGQLKEAGKIVDLDIHRAWHKASNPIPTDKYIYGLLDGACGKDQMWNVAKAIGLEYKWLPQSNKFKNYTFYTVYDYIRTVEK